MDSNMRLPCLSLLLIHLLVVLSEAPLAADSSIPARLSVSQAISLALDANPDLKSAFRGRETSLSNLRMAGIQTTYGIGSTVKLDHSPGDSSLDGLVSYDLTHQNLAGTKASAAVSPIGTGSDRGSVGLRLTHPLMRGKGALSPKSDALQSALSNTNISERELYRSRQATTIAVVRAYFNAVLAAEQVAVQE